MPIDATTPPDVLAELLRRSRIDAQRNAIRSVWGSSAFQDYAFGSDIDCTAPDMYGRPDCVFAWLEFQEERVSSLERDLSEAMRSNKLLAQKPSVLVWRQNFLPAWNERRTELRDTLLAKTDAMEILEGAPDNPEEDATPEHRELDDWARQIAQYQKEFQAAGVGVKGAEFPKELPPEKSVIEETSGLVANIALLGAVGLAAYLLVNVSRR